MLPNKTFVLTNGSSIVISDDVWHIGPDQDPAPRLLYHRDDVEGDLTGPTAGVDGPEGVVVGEEGMHEEGALWRTCACKTDGLMFPVSLWGLENILVKRLILLIILLVLVIHHND